MQKPDYRIRFSSALIDFDRDVHRGMLRGHQIENWPEPGQARYDWMRMVVLGLLSNQASVDPPINYREGTLWYSLLDNFFKYFNGIDFVDLANGIKINDIDLVDWADRIDDVAKKLSDTGTFSGVVDRIRIDSIDIPNHLISVASDDLNRPFVYADGLLVDPRLTIFNSNRTKILLLNNQIGDARLRSRQKYTVVIERIDLEVGETVIIQ